MDYRNIRKKANLSILCSLAFHGLAYNLVDVYQQNNFFKSIFILMIPASCLIFVLYKYFQLQQRDKVELARTFIFMMAIGILAWDRLF